MTPLVPNEGTRPSRLMLGRYATGELSEAERIAVEATLDEAARDHLAELEAARSQVRPLDLAALQARSSGVDSFPEPVAPPANRSRGWYGLVLLAALVLLGALPMLMPHAGVPEGYVGVRGGAALEVFQLEEGRLIPYAGDAVGEGDFLGFRVRGAAEGVVLLSVDGEGQVSVYWPERGDAPEPLPRDGALPGSVELDDASGPEVFVAVFDAPVGVAEAEAGRRWRSGGPEALLDWAERAPEVDAVRVERR